MSATFDPLTDDAKVVRASHFAQVVHAGQFDKSGLAYFTSHILDVVRLVKEREKEAKAFGREVLTPEQYYVALAAAYLHDVLEDHPEGFPPLTAQMLLDLRFPPEVVEVVVLLTSIKGEDRAERLAKIAEHPIARRVKTADQDSNTRPSRVRRLARFDPETAIRLLKKYLAGYEVLGEASLWGSTAETLADLESGKFQAEWDDA